MNLAEINIDCLRAAESLLRDHDARIAAAVEELKQLRRDRVTLSERVQACIDVLCGRATPDLFTPPATPAVVVAEPQPVEEEPPAEAAPPAPPLPPPSGLLRDIPGLTPADAEDLEGINLRTLADLEAKLTEDLSDYFRATRSVNAQVYKVLVVPKGVFLGPDADRVANAVEKYLTVAAAVTVPVVETAEVMDEVPAAEKVPKEKGKKKAKGGGKKKAKAAG